MRTQGITALERLVAKQFGGSKNFVIDLSNWLKIEVIVENRSNWLKIDVIG
jgi:hypothetical protein